MGDLQANAKAREDALNADDEAQASLTLVKQLREQLETAISRGAGSGVISVLANKLNVAEQSRQFTEFKAKLARSSMDSHPVNNNWGEAGKCPAVDAKAKAFFSMLPKGADIDGLRASMVADMNSKSFSDCTAATAAVEGTLLKSVLTYVIPDVEPTKPQVVMNTTMKRNRTAMEGGCASACSTKLKGLLMALYGQKAGKVMATKLWTILANQTKYNASVVAESVFDALAEISVDAAKQDQMTEAIEGPYTPQMREAKLKAGPVMLLKEVYLNMAHMRGNHSLYSADQVNVTNGDTSPQSKVFQKMIRTNKAESVAEMLLSRMLFFLKTRADKKKQASFLETGQFQMSWFTAPDFPEAR